MNTLSERYPDLVVICQPSNEFGKQEPDSGKELYDRIRREFSDEKYGLVLLDKAKVNGDDATPLYKYLKKVLPGWWSGRIKWNFTKFLVDKNGIPRKRYGPQDSPFSFEDEIKKLLNE